MVLAMSGDFRTYVLKMEEVRTVMLDRIIIAPIKLTLIKGAFVVAFLSMLFLIGLPLFFLEISLAQYTKFGPIEIWKVVPAFRGRFICFFLFKAAC